MLPFNLHDGHEPSAETIKLVISDAFFIVRLGLKRMLAMERDLLVVGEASNEVETCGVVARLKPDLLLLGLETTEQGIAEILLGLGNKCPSTRILLLCSVVDEITILNAAKAGAHGCVILDSLAVSSLTSAIRTIYGGHIWLDDKLGCRETFAAFTRAKCEPAINDGANDLTRLLTKREQEVLSLVSEGLTNKNISERLCISQRTVKIHLNNIFHKLGVNNRTQAALRRTRDDVHIAPARVSIGSERNIPRLKLAM